MLRMPASSTFRQHVLQWVGWIASPVLLTKIRLYHTFRIIIIVRIIVMMQVWNRMTLLY